MSLLTGFVCSTRTYQLAAAFCAFAPTCLFMFLMKEGIREKERASALSIDMVTFMIEVRGSMRGHDLIYRWDYH